MSVKIDNMPRVSQEIASSPPVQENKSFSTAQKVALVAAGVFLFALSSVGNVLLYPLQFFRFIPSVNAFLNYGFNVSMGWIKSASQTFTQTAPSIKKQMLFVLSLNYTLMKESAGTWKPAHEIATVNGKKLVLGRILRQNDKALGDFEIKRVAAFVEQFEVDNDNAMGIMTKEDIKKADAERKLYSTQDFTLPKKDEILGFCGDFLNPQTAGNTYGHCKAGRARSALQFLAVLAVAGMVDSSKVHGLSMPNKPASEDDYIQYLKDIYAVMKQKRPQIDLGEKHFKHLAGVLSEINENEWTKFRGYLAS